MEQTASSPLNPLAGALRDLPIGTLYTLGRKAQLVEALLLCQKNAVALPVWKKSGELLSVDVGNALVHEVSLHLNKGGRIETRCRCGNRATGDVCAHSLAALLTLKKALVPAAVSGWRAVDADLEKIRTSLLAPVLPRSEKIGPRKRKSSANKPDSRPRDQADYAIVLSERYGIPFVEVTRKGDVLLPFTHRVPKPLQPLLESPWMAGGHSATALCALLEAGKPTWPVQVRDSGGRLHTLKVEASQALKGKLVFDARDSGLRLQRVLDDGSCLGGRLLWFGSWVADAQHARLVRVVAPEVWSLWPQLAAVGTTVEDGAGCLVAWRDFGGIEFMSDEDSPPLEECLLQIDGQEQQVLPTHLRDYSLEINPGADDEVTLRAVARHGACELGLDSRALALFSEAFFDGVSLPLRALKRRRALYETFFAARRATTKTERNRILRKNIAGADFRRRALVSEARGRLENLLECERQCTWHLSFAEEHWLLLQRDRALEAELLEVLYGYFGVAALRDAPFAGAMRVKRQTLFTALPALVGELRALGVDLRYGGRPAVPARLDIRVTAGAKDIDWFELRPEISCAGVALDEETWRKALEEGIFEADGCLHLLEAGDREALTVLAGLRGAGQKKAHREPVLIPRLHILDLLALRKLGATLHLGAEDETILARLENFDKLPEVDEPRLRAKLRDYQGLGYRWLAFLYEHKFGACLADDMGLGKTIQAISLLAALHQGVLAARAPRDIPHLVVVPPSLLFNWESELTRFAPDLRTLVYRGQDRCLNAFEGIDVVLTSYEIVRRDIEELCALTFHVIIFDEAQAIKNVHAAVTGAARRLQGAFKLALTGTPVENHLGEYWSIIDLVLPGLLGPYRRFGSNRREVEPGALQRLIARTKPFVLRRTKEKIAAELPDKVEIDLHLDLSAEQKVLYQNTVAAVRTEVAAAWQEQNRAQARITALAALTRLRRLCLDPRLAGGTAQDGASPKIAALCEHLEELQAEGHSSLVFSQFTSFLDLVEPHLRAAGHGFIRLDGSTPVAQRKKLVEAFQNSEEPLVFLLSLKAGGRGLNLTRASYVIHLDPWWNPAVENQASDRAHRIGQTRKVTVLRLLMRHTVEEKMMVLKERKQRLFQALLDEGRDGGGVPLSREDFEFLVGD